MSASTNELKLTLAKLPEQDRAELAHFLLQTLDDGADDDAEAAWETELARRAEEIRSGRAISEPAEAVFAALREKHG
jgi:putative addiction module component (TIGR02574 family)